MVGPQTIIGVIGSGNCGGETMSLARSVGALIAKKGAAMVCGGLGGVMEAAAQGASEEGGLTIGILPGSNSGERNPYINLPIVTDLGHARNVIIAHTAGALIAVAGEYGTLSEISIALKLGKPVACLDSKWSGVDGVIPVRTPEEAIEAVFERIG